MASFDRSKWLRRARNKLARRGEAGEPEHARDYIAIDGLERAVAWAKNNEITVDFIKISSGRFHSASRRVEISSHLQPEIQLHTLLHELGHFLIGNEGDAAVEYKYPNGYRRIEQDMPGRGVLHKIDVVAEEYEAWALGRLLAEKTGITIDREAYDKTRARYLQSYFRWALKRGRVSDGD